MTLSCSCPDYSDAEWYYYFSDDFKTLDTVRGKRCCSCKNMIKPGSVVVKFYRCRPVRDEEPYIEERIYGDEVPLSSWYMCEECGGLFYALEELGFCITIGDVSMQELVNDYRNLFHPG
jgi:predicted RNA-binding Zn-ribbon protein involved in translation (DUF1610 family)